MMNNVYDDDDKCYIILRDDVLMVGVKWAFMVLWTWKR
jgi:hypothetical protein